MNEAQVRTVQQVRQILAGTEPLQFEIKGGVQARYDWICSVLERLRYRQLRRSDRGVVLAYLRRFSGYSRAQLTRLVHRWLADDKLAVRYRAPTHAFARRYTDADVALLAQVDCAMDELSGPATAHVLRRQLALYGNERYRRLAGISPAHIYNLRASSRYRRQRVSLTKTSPVKANTIGVRKAPAPESRPGFIRIDSVHQGDKDGIKGLHHINAVDCVTQWQIVASVQAISEAYLLPVIAMMLSEFPFHILGFHSDNGSEYVNHRVARLLEKLRVEFTKSRPRRSNDNGLAETKNGAVLRKVFGYEHIGQRHAKRFNAFCTEHLNPFVNYHRPCLFATEVADPNKPGRIKRIYRPKDAMTPLEKLASLSDVQQYLRPGVTLQALQQQARSMSDIEAGQALNAARQKLFAKVHAGARVA